MNARKFLEKKFKITHPESDPYSMTNTSYSTNDWMAWMEEYANQVYDFEFNKKKELAQSGVRLSFDELKNNILKNKAKSEYKQASIIILRNIFEENEA